MRTVESLIRELQKFPPLAMCKAFEGEETGIVVRDRVTGDEAGFVPASMHDVDESHEPAHINGEGG